jgi:hypothetical protein
MRALIVPKGRSTVYASWRHEPCVMPQLLELACPLMRRCARFHANAARRIGKELKKLSFD